MTRWPDHPMTRSFRSLLVAGAGGFGHLLLLDWVDLHRGQDFVQPGKDFVAVDRLDAVFHTISSGAHTQDVFVAGSVSVGVVVLRLGLRHGAGGKVGGRL